MNLSFRDHKKTWIFTSLIALVLIVRAILPSILLKQINQSLDSFSPLYAMHIRDLDLHFYRMAYSFDEVEGHLKKGNVHFLAIKKVEVALAWREIFKGRLVADVELHQANIDITTQTINALSGVGAEQAKSDAKNVKDATIPFDLERLQCDDSMFQFSDVAGLPPEQKFYLSHIEVIANNLTPADEKSLGLITAVGSIQDNAKIKVVAEIRTKKTPAEWSVNLEVKDFTLTKINPIAKRMVPVTFKSGALTLFVAVQSVQGNLKGYAKPFLKDLVFVGDRGDFKSFWHFIIEIAGTIGNFFLKNSDSHALATRVNFHTDNGKVVTDTGAAIGSAIKNAFGKGLSPSFDETLALDEVPKVADPSIEAKQTAAQLETPYVTELRFPKNRSSLDAKELTKLKTALHAVGKKSDLERITFVVWGDREMPEVTNPEKKAAAKKWNEADVKLADSRGEVLKKYLERETHLSMNVINMAKTPSDFAKFLKTESARVQSGLVSAGATDPKASRAFVVLSGKK